MILLDLNQVVIANLMQHFNFSAKGAAVNEPLVRHMVLNSIRSYNQQFGAKYGKMIVCCDNRQYWRGRVFPYYKMHRKRDRDASDFNWNEIFQCLNKVKEELKTYAPFNVIEVVGAEADDIIAVLSKKFSSRGSSTLIVSSDKDFLQLQKWPRVDQYSPFHKRFLKTGDPEKLLKEHILRGDKGDGIPNFLSSDASIINDERQKSLNKKKMEVWLEQDPKVFCTTQTMQSGYERNKMLIDLDQIPQDVADAIWAAYHDPHNTMTDFMNYLSRNKLKSLLEVADEFRSYDV